MLDINGFLCISSRAYTVNGTVTVFLLDLEKFANVRSCSPPLWSHRALCMLFPAYTETCPLQFVIFRDCVLT